MSAPTDDLIELVLPARTEFAATVRVLAASLGADLGFSVDDIDDMRIALNEVFTSVADSDTPQRIALSFRATAGSLDVEASVVGDDELELDELALTILRAVVDEVTVTSRTVRLVKHVGATVDELDASERERLVRQMRDIEAAGVHVTVWLATVPSISAMVDVIQ